MTLPARVIQAVRPAASPGVMAGAAVVAATFAATPFLLPEISTDFTMEIGSTGLLSTAQVGSFAAASFLAGRLFRPRRRLHYGALGIVAVASAASALAPNFPFLLGGRVVAGAGMGVLTWIAWADATRFARGIGDVAAVAPLTAAVASPILGWLTERGGYPLVYGVLALAALVAMALKVDFGELPRIGRRVSSSKSNRVLLVALGLLTLGGSSIFIFTGAAAIRVHGLSPVHVSWALSINAVAGVIATRVPARKGTSWLWIVATAASGLAVGIIESSVVFFAAMALWGFAFWMAVPASLQMLAERSVSPSERMGDAQASMAMGRVVGPVVGGLALGAGAFSRLSWVGAMVMIGSGLIVAMVEVYRRTAPPLPELRSSDLG